MSVIGERFPRTVSDLRDQTSLVNGALAGYGRLIGDYALTVPRPKILAVTAGQHRTRQQRDWVIFPERYAPENTLTAQLTFALRWEGVNLAVLDALFKTVSASAVEEAVRSAPTGASMRRLWFLYEWLTGKALDIPDLGKVRAVPVLDPERQLGIENAAISARHRVRNNLPGTSAFCPLVFRTDRIAALEKAQLAEEARKVIGRTRADVMARAAAFLLLEDSRASYDIEGERPSPDRLLRWGQTVQRAGATRLSLAELESLQRQVIGDSRFVKLGLRTDGGFVGEHDRYTQAPIPDHISARPDDLESLVQGIVAFGQRAASGGMDPVVSAASMAFGFVYVHPFDDGNGRIHRWLIHHVLAASGFAAPGFVFPVSAVMLREIQEYKRTLESYSARLLPLIKWEPTSTNNVNVLNETASWYRFFDATPHAEFLYHCVDATIRNDLPHEVEFLTAYDAFIEGVQQIIDMPSRTVSLLHSFLYQNAGRLSIRARTREFAELTESEIASIEKLYASTHERLRELRHADDHDNADSGQPMS